jgi:PPK2 family polyphosphate:nucleotide phosphotransferase
MPKRRELVRLVERCRVEHGTRFSLADHDPGATPGVRSRAEGERRLAADLQRLDELQAKLYAMDRWSVLIILQGMDASGKDGVVRHVMSGLSPQGTQVFSFKAPSTEELDHDFLWRCIRRLPERGRFGIFNRSWYEEVLIVRVHPEILAGQKLPVRLVTRHIWKERYEDIVAFERHLVRNGTLVLKFFLNLSRDEQRKRFLARIDEPRKNWKFSVQDAAERKHWTRYMSAYQDMIRGTASAHAPWHVVPADSKWYARLAVATILADALEGLGLAYPRLDRQKRHELAVARKHLKRS